MRSKHNSKQNIDMKKALFICGILLIAVSCKKKNDDNIPEFDKASLLINVADNLIIPAINAFDASIQTLETEFSTFMSSPSSQEFEALRNSWKDSYLLWQAVKVYDFGPMKDYAQKASICTFPTDTTIVLNNITSGSYSLATAANIDAVGLSALDFLLYRHNALSELQTNSNYRTYVYDLIQKLKSESALLKSLWAAYRGTFISSTGTESTSAFSQLVNEFNRDYELGKNAKLGIPIGKQSLGIQLPEYIEVRYSGLSLEILKASMTRLHQLYNGNSFIGSNEGIGFDDYLVHLERTDLSNTINNKFAQIVQNIQSFNGTLEEEMHVNAAGLDQLYTLIAGQVVNIKTDMTSAFGVLITYQDNDGD